MRHARTPRTIHVFGLGLTLGLTGCLEQLKIPEDSGWDDSATEDSGRVFNPPCNWYYDADGDGYGTDGSHIVDDCDAALGSGWVLDGGDCDDADANVNPGATELCDGVDNNCDTFTDEDSAADATLWYGDSDGDNYGDSANRRQSCDQPDGYVPVATDCDDENADINPAATEVCNGLDDNCDGYTDDADSMLDMGTTSTWYADTDSDGFGDATNTIQACDAGSGYVNNDTDCDDTNPAINPAQAEDCFNGADDDCDGTTDLPETWYTDADGDGFGDETSSTVECTQPSGTVLDDIDGDGNADFDCDDLDPTISPGAAEYCDGIDHDCDGLVNEPDSVDVSTWYQDTDGDSYGDNASFTTSCSQPSGFVSDNSDCDDTDVNVNPAANEVCDSVDNDCDSSIDDADTSVSYSASDWWYADADSDSYGDASTSTQQCTQPSGYVDNDNDCDDADSGVNPDADEHCSDGVDSNCDGSDDDGAVDASNWYPDLDGDGYGDDSSSLSACSQPSGYISTDGDCDDADSSINPSATESCDGIDSNCDGIWDVLAEYDFDDGTGSTLTDLGPYGDDGNISGATWSASGDGISGSGGDYALDFDATAGDYIQISSTTIVPTTGELTVSAWVQPIDISDGGWYTALGYGSGSNTFNAYWLGYGSTKVYGYTDESYATRSITDNVDVSTDHTDGSWHHVVMTWDSGSSYRQLFVDGVLVASDNSGPISLYSTGSTNLYIGADENNGSLDSFFNGLIDEVQILDCTVDSSTVGSAYSTNSPLF